MVRSRGRFDEEFWDRRRDPDGPGQRKPAGWKRSSGSVPRTPARRKGGSRDGSTGITWVIDPLDGTVNYLYGLPVWAVSVGVLHGDRPIVGVVHAPALGSVWRGSPRPHPMAELNGTPIAASQCPTLGEALVGTGFGYQADVRAQQGRIVAALLPRVRDIRRAGAAAVDLCWVAQGLLDGYYERGTHLWDRAAGTAIAQAAGARGGRSGWRTCNRQHDDRRRCAPVRTTA